MEKFKLLERQLIRNRVQINRKQDFWAKTLDIIQSTTNLLSTIYEIILIHQILYTLETIASK